MSICLLVLTPELEPPLFVELESRKIIIGRCEQARVCLPDASISSLHCSLRKRGQQYLLLDEESARGTAIRQEDQWTWLSAHAPRVLQCGTIFRVGDIQLQLVLKQSRKSQLDPRGLTTNLAKDLVGAALSKVMSAPSEKQVQSALKELLELPEPSQSPREQKILQPQSAQAHNESAPAAALPVARSKLSLPLAFRRDSTWDLLFTLLIIGLLGSLALAWFLHRASHY